MSVVRHFNARATSTTWYYNPVARTNAIYKDVAAGREAASVSVLGRPRRGTFCKSRRIGATPVFVLQQASGAGAADDAGAESFTGGRLLAFLDNVSSLGQELRAAGDSWFNARVDALDAAVSRLRGAVRPAGQRLREELRQQCSEPVFTPPSDVPAMIEGPGVSYTQTSGSCQLSRKADSVQRDLILTCTDPGVTVSRTVPRYTSALLAPAMFVAAECKSTNQFGRAASVSVDLWQPGQRPQDVIKAWQQRLNRWRQRPAGQREGAAGGAGGGSGAGGDMAMMAQLHAAPSAAVEEALSRHQQAITQALAAWAGDHRAASGSSGGSGGSGGSGPGSGSRRLVGAVDALLTDLGMEAAAEQLRLQLQHSAPDPGQPFRAADDSGGPGDGGPAGLWDTAANVSHLFELVAEAGLRAVRRTAINRDEDAAGTTGGGGGVAGTTGGGGVAGTTGGGGARRLRAARGGVETTTQGGAVEVVDSEVGRGDESEEGGDCGSVGQRVMQELAAEIERLLQL